MKTNEDNNKVNTKKRKRLAKQLQLIDTSEQDGMFSTDDWETVDMQKQLHPIGYYINDREEMIRQMFNVIQGERLKNMLPLILKDVDLDDLKADCLIQLVGMSSKRIKSILSGHDLEISSDESDSDNGTNRNLAINTNVRSKSKGRKQKHLKLSTSVSAISNSNLKYNNQKLVDNCSSLSDENTLDISVTKSDMCEDLVLNSKEVVKLPKIKKHVKDAKQGVTKRHRVAGQTSTAVASGEISNEDYVNELIEKKISESSIAEMIEAGTGIVEGGETKGKTMWEILELEMRARAIRALLERADTPQKEGSTAQPVKENSSETSKIANSVAQLQTTLDTVDLTVIDDSVDRDPTPIHEEKENKNSSETVIIVSEAVDANRSTTSNNEESGNVCVSVDANNEQNASDIVTVTEKTDIDDNCNNSWAQRWLEKKSKDVKRLVSTSKMCTTIRNKMKLKSNKRVATDMTCSTNELSDVKQNSPIEFKGSIEEYKMLTGKQEESQQTLLKSDSTNNDNKNENLAVEKNVDVNETVTDSIVEL